MTDQCNCGTCVSCVEAWTNERRMQVGKIDSFFSHKPGQVVAAPAEGNGLSFRDQSAIAALQGLLSSKPFNKVDISRSAYEYADALDDERRNRQ